MAMALLRYSKQLANIAVMNGAMERSTYSAVSQPTVY